MSALAELELHVQNQREAVASLSAIIPELAAEAAHGGRASRSVAADRCVGARHARMECANLVRYYESLVYGQPRTTWKWYESECLSLRAGGS